MRILFTLNIVLFLCFSTVAQKKLDRTLRTLNNETVPYLENSKAVNENGITFLDTREINEFETSHIKNAIWVGYDSFDSQIINDSVPDKTTPIVVYCSIGVRSEDIGEKLQEMGYSNVRNLYGGIFKWKNDGYPVFDQENKETEKVHAYDKLWGKLLTKGEKVYE